MSSSPALNSFILIFFAVVLCASKASGSISFVGTAEGDAGENEFSSVIGDTTHLYALGSGGKLVKFSKDTFQRVEAITLSCEANFMQVDDTTLYAVCPTNPGKVLKVSLTSFTETASLELASDEVQPWRMTQDTNYLYVPCSNGRIPRVAKSTFLRQDRVEIPNPTGGAGSDTTIVDDHLFLVHGDPVIKVSKITASTMTFVSTLTFESDEENGLGLVITSDNGNLTGYVTARETISLHAFNPETMERLDKLRINLDQTYDGVAIGSLFYTATRSAPLRVAEIDLTSYSVTSTTELSTSDNAEMQYYVDGDVIYFPSKQSPGRLVKAQTTPNTPSPPVTTTTTMPSTTATSSTSTSTTTIVSSPVTTVSNTQGATPSSFISTTAAPESAPTTTTASTLEPTTLTQASSEGSNSVGVIFSEVSSAGVQAAPVTSLLLLCALAIFFF